MMKIIVFSFILLKFSNCAKYTFDNYSLYKVYYENEQQGKLLVELQNDERYDFWKEPVATAKFVNIMSSPINKDGLESFLKQNHLKYEITIENIQEVINNESIKKYIRNNETKMEWDTYYKLEDINAWIDDLIKENPDIASEIIAGETIENRNIKGIKISHGAGKKAVVIEGGIHSREWISTATVCYLINELLYSENENIRAAAKDYDWYIFPVVNPDGYVYSHEVNRFWRKNRREIITSSGVSYGIDLNRNWNSNWLRFGVSVNPNAENYAGPGPFSEPETRSFSSYLRTIADQIELYLSFHSYGQILLLPFGNSTQPLANYVDAMNIGTRALRSLWVRNGTQYTIGNIAEAIYPATGGSIDWVKEHLKIPLVYCYELRDTGTYGFALPPDQILDNSMEVMDSLLEILHQAKRYGYMLT